MNGISADIANDIISYLIFYSISSSKRKDISNDKAHGIANGAVIQLLSYVKFKIGKY